MSGIYIHIPFCKKACHYCDFHFSTSLKYKQSFLEALALEVKLRSKEFKDEAVETIYFGGGTPSILELEEIQDILTQVYQHYQVVKEAEITLEANPDDLTEEKIIALSQTDINRLSIGVQSFGDKELKMMNRAHNAQEVEACLRVATQYFENITIDLMYGIPGLTHEEWKANIQKALAFKINHISSYALTVEEGTALANFVKKGTYPQVEEVLAAQHFDILISELEKAGFDHYEISNFGKPGFYSKHNTAYWFGKPYLGFGPSAHSYQQNSRSWNVANNSKYIHAMLKKELPSTIEQLSKQDAYNEMIMMGLRTQWGISLDKVEDLYGKERLEVLIKNANQYLENHTLTIKSGCLKTTQKGKFLADGIAAELFVVE